MTCPRLPNSTSTLSMASPDGVRAVDIRMRVGPATARDPFLRRLR